MGQEVRVGLQHSFCHDQVFASDETQRRPSHCYVGTWLRCSIKSIILCLLKIIEIIDGPGGERGVAVVLHDNQS